MKGFQNWNIETCQPPSPVCYCFCLGWYPPSFMPATLEVYINSPLPTSFPSLVLRPVACPFPFFLSFAGNALFSHPPLPSRFCSFRTTVISSRRSRTQNYGANGLGLVSSVGARFHGADADRAHAEQLAPPRRHAHGCLSPGLARLWQSLDGG
jgi:hypothetical protein